MFKDKCSECLSNGGLFYVSTYVSENNLCTALQSMLAIFIKKKVNVAIIRDPDGYI